MAVTYKTFSDDLVGKDLTYPDNFYKLKGTKYIPEDGFTFTEYNALKSPVSTRTNNLSNLFLTRKCLNDEWLDPNIYSIDEQLGLATTMSWFSSLPQNDSNPGAWLYFDKTYEFWDAYITEVAYTLTANRPTSDYGNYIFYVEILDETRCRISHTFSDIIFYLTCSSSNSIKFIKEPSNDEEVFLYMIQDNYMKLYKNHDGILKTIKVNKDTWTLEMTTDLTDESNIIYITNNILDFDFYVNNSYIAYDRSSSVQSIDTTRSAFSLESQALIHHQYNSDDAVNFIPLKNNLTYKGNTVRGDNLAQTGDDTYPAVNYRTYNGISAGVNQEFGPDNITLTFTFHDQEYNIEDGEDLAISIPSTADNGGINPLYPYAQLNIADSKFIVNGAFASEVPYLSDTFKKLQNENSAIEGSSNSGTYLCTWLYKNDVESEPIWLDRWYYPDKISRKSALTASCYAESFDNLIDNVYCADTEDNAENAEALSLRFRQETYVDKISDMVLEPNCSYIYSRVSSDDINKVVENLDEYRISSGYKKGGAEVELGSSFDFDNDVYVQIKAEQFNKTNALNFNTDIYLDADKQIGIQIVGTDIEHGFNIQNRKDIAPFHYFATDNIIYLLNNDFEVRHQFDLNTKYDDKIIRFVLGDIFDDVIIFTSLYLYIFTYDLRLKTRYNYSDIGNIELPSIYNMTTTTETNDDGDYVVPLVTYPFKEMVDVDCNYANSFSVDIVLSKDEETDSYPFPYGTIENVSYYSSYFRKTSLGTDITTSGECIMYNDFAKMIAISNPLLHNDNLYIPFYQNVLKIIFIPENDSDQDALTSSESTIAIRRLAETEYYPSYNREDASTEGDKTIILENDMIETSASYKYLHFDTDENLYAFNFDKMALAPDTNTMYGIYSDDAYIASGGWYWVYAQSLSQIQSSVSSSKYVEFASSASIDHIKLNTNDDMLMIRNFGVSLDLVDTEQRMDVYDKTRALIFTESLEDYTSILCVDSYNYINTDKEEKCVFVIIAETADGELYKIEYESGATEITSKSLEEFEGDATANFYETTNTNCILKYSGTNKLYFNLFLPSDYLYETKLNYTWDISQIEAGWYNINVSIDLDNGYYDIRINNDLVYQEEFDSYTYANGTIFDTSYFFGNIGKRYGTTLNNILRGGRYDPYACKNSKIKNTKLYTKALNHHEYLSMRLDGIPISPLTITLPCGTRNMIDEIVRYFRYTTPSAMSNKVKLNIGGTGLTTSAEYALLKSEIMEALENNCDALVEVADVEFI